MKKLFIVCISLAYAQLFAQSSDANNKKTAADIYWETKPVANEPFTFNGNDNASDKIIASLNLESYSRRLRCWGMEFWKKFPNDPRRFDWFRETTQWAFEPAYFIDTLEGAIAKSQFKYGIFRIDTNSRKEWRQFYNKYRDEYIVSLDSSERKNYLNSEIGFKVLENQWRSDENEKFDFKDLAEKFKYYALNYFPKKPDLSGAFARFNFPFGYNTPLTHKNCLGLTDADVLQYISMLKESDHQALQKAATQMEEIMKLRNNPLEFRSKDYKGRTVDLKQYKGKLVLIDIWSLNCTSCVARMPEIKDIYE